MIDPVKPCHHVSEQCSFFRTEQKLRFGVLSLLSNERYEEVCLSNGRSGADASAHLSSNTWLDYYTPVVTPLYHPQD